MTIVDAVRQWIHSLQLFLLWSGGIVAFIWLVCAALRFLAPLSDALRPRPSRPAPHSRSAVVRWQVIQRDHDRIKDEYGQLRIDPFRDDELAVLDDMTVPEAVVLVQALAAASDAAETADPPTYEKAVLHLAKAWRQAQARAAKPEPQPLLDRTLEPGARTTESGVQPTRRRPRPSNPKEQKCR
ncbi:hypothetical protein ACFRSX_32715 [Streptomyces goshikiensis]|uniref:hypothetical protein n=1 Tax=Streptomyces TaxID=1883 RepID=UPI000C27D8BA|nr:hypothetical protein [Streptomyces sp. CB02120-2]PJN14544.1 hypothetical protein CG724_33165 [Streptomyces sp. CB02120-2]